MAVIATVVVFCFIGLWGSGSQAEAQDQEFTRGVSVCVTKVLTGSVPPGTGADLSPFTIELETAAGEPVASGNVEAIGADGGCSDFQPSVRLDATVSSTNGLLPTLVLRESVASGPVRPIEFECEEFGGTPVVDLNGFPAVQLTQQDYETVEGSIFCSVVNSAIRVCAFKDLSSTAVAAGFSAEDFAIAYTDGAGLAGTENFASLPEVPIQGPCLGDGATGQVEFYLPPATDTRTLTFTEPTVEGPIGLVAASCIFIYPGEDFAIVASANENDEVILELPFSDFGQIDCLFDNDTVRVCVGKLLSPSAASSGQAAGFTSDAAFVGQFDFSLSVTDAGTVEPYFPQTPTDPPLPLDEPNCQTPQDIGSNLPESAAWYVAPGAEITITEAAPESSPVRPISVLCGSGLEAALVDSSITITAPLSGNVECVFLNDAIIVCINKTVGSNVDFLPLEDGSPEPWSFSAVSQMTSVPVAEAIPECESPTFFVSPGAQFKVSEQISQAASLHVGLVTASCSLGEGAIVPADDTGEVTFTAPLSSKSGPVNCDFTNDSVLVCVTKNVGLTAQGLDLDLSAEPVPWQFAMQSQMSPVPSISAPDGCGNTPAFLLAPGQAFRLEELVRDDLLNQVGLVGEPSCTIVDDATFTAGDDGVIAGTAPTGANGRIDCSFTNDSVLVCVTKQFGKNVDEGGLPASPGTFAVTVNGETVEEAIVPTLGGEGDLCADGESLKFGFRAAPGAAITLTETLPDGSPLRLVSAECEFVAEEPVEVPTTLDGQTVSFDLISQDPVDCRVRNDAGIVCVTKTVGDEAFFEAGVLPTDFGFTVLVDGEQMPSLPNACQGSDQDEGSVSQSAAFGFAVLPGSTFTVTENASPSVAGLVEAQCFAGDLPDIDGDLASRSVTVDLELAEVDFARCTFTNNVTSLCVVKALGANAASVGLTTSDFTFTVEADGQAVPASVEACEIRSGVGTGFILRPNSGFTITESATSTAVPSGLIDVFCNVESTPAIDLAAATATVAGDHDEDSIACTFTNETAVVCVTKRMDTGVTSAGYGLEDFSFQLEVDGASVGDPVVPAPATDDASCTTDQERAGVATLLSAPGTDYAVTEIIGDGVRADVGSAQCESTSTFAERTVAFTPDTSNGDGFTGDNVSDERIAIEPTSPYSYSCDFFNLSIPITINKTVINDDAGVLTVSDFVFDVFDSDGELIASVTDPDAGDTGAVVYVAPGTMFTVTERAVDGYDTTSAACAQTSSDQALAGTSVTYELGEFELSTTCTFVNDDVPPIPVCAMLIFEEGDSDFTLADFSLELFQDGALIGQRTADESLDTICEEQSDTTASLLPASLVLLDEVFADGSTFSFVAAIDDPDELVVFEASTCTVDSPSPLQALRGPDPVAFTADEGATRVICVAQASAMAPQTTTVTSGSRPAFVPDPEPVAAAAVPVAAVAPTQVISTAIAVTGSSTTDVTIPIALALLSAGFAGMGVGRTRRRRLD